MTLSTTEADRALVRRFALLYMKASTVESERKAAEFGEKADHLEREILTLLLMLRSTAETLTAQLTALRPDPAWDGVTHHANCYAAKGHHECAVAEANRLREKVQEMNRRCSRMEAGLTVKVEEVRRAGPSLGRALSASACVMYEAQRDRARAQLATAKEHIVALRGFSDHDVGCLLGDACNCGLSALLRSTNTEGE